MGKADIIGLGRSGIAAARLLKKQGWETSLSDRNSSPSLEQTRQQLSNEGISVHVGDNYRLDPANLPHLIVVSPGVPWDLPVLQQAREAGINTIGELELAWRTLNTSPWVGITGTNGKTTTTALIAAIFQNAGLSAPACGNIGHAACELALTEIHYDWIVAEISSYQCESAQDLAPKIGIWTTFTPDHLSRHKTLDNYYAIKASLLGRSGLKIFNGDDPYLYEIGRTQWPDAYWTSVRGKDHLIGNPDKGIYLQDNWIVAFGELIAPINLLKMSGQHNWQNLLMAVGAARLAGIEKQAITATIASFPGVPHRLEYICTKEGVNFINDSKATNYDAALVALKAFSEPVILIAGGEAKEGDDRNWITGIKNKSARVLLIGEAAPAFAARLEENGYGDYEVVETMDKAVTRGLEAALESGVKTVLLSPACASFDQYRSFEHRGDNFRELCKSL
ncbi:MAG: UDP-N-acetylmuramoylalanine--D-glutamate ligase [Chroococcopsis gigantea SAG 12.99]|jgi:UDP-N-acetylmuramoylalanine--D-glutamate ligase|nr:UDP-N-acetylmuramoyl-L-alanine--D-glutamate ligase [Chlorogloea purpurea SAG 13.99]MDV3000507.1 UDP-N-acetylmuramoylalanine--D-glutamate ligase [Chroococcopsis gigantea SAG 12.99]